MILSSYHKILSRLKGIIGFSVSKKGIQHVNRTFLADFNELKYQENLIQSRFIFEEIDFYPCLNDNTANTYFDRHYVIHPAWAARVIKTYNPIVHYDISSTLQFGATLSAFYPVKFFDYRPATIKLSNYSSEHADLLALPFQDSSIFSLSCMHTIEHVGLGRYGDPLDYNGDVKAIKELIRVVKIGGNLLIVVPIANVSKIYFNAHRVYNSSEFISLFDAMELMEFSLIPDSEKDGDLIKNPEDNLLSIQKYACGCFWFKKLHT